MTRDEMKEMMAERQEEVEWLEEQERDLEAEWWEKQKLEWWEDEEWERRFERA